MSKDSKKPSFFQGAILLSAATAIVKVLGALYKIPLKQIIGDEGFGYFNTAYEIYSLLLMVCTAGLPVAMSRMISESASLGHGNQVRRVYSTARTLFLTLGILGTAFMTLFCKQLATAQGQLDACYAIACLGPCVLLLCIMSAYRGFFQGHGNMLPTSVSQVLEAIVKLTVGIGLALFIMRRSGNIPQAAGGAILGVTVSCVVSVFYLMTRFHRSYRLLPAGSDTPASFRSTARQLLSFAIPITVGQAGLQLLTVLETGIYMDNLTSLLAAGRYDHPVISLLQAQILEKNSEISLQDLQNKVSANLKGIYNMTQTVYNLPVAFIPPITISIIPFVTSRLTRGEHGQARALAEAAARITGLVCMPCTVGLTVLSAPIMALLGGYSGEKLALAAGLMSIQGVCILFNALVLLTNALMQAHNHATLPVVNMFVGGLVKLAAVFILTANPRIGIYGTPIGSLLCYLCITVLNLLTMRRCIHTCPSIVPNLGRSALAAAIMGAFAYGCYRGLSLFTDSRLLLCAVPVAVGAGVYLAAAIKLKAITLSDCLLLPKGDKLAKILKL